MEENTEIVTKQEEQSADGNLPEQKSAPESLSSTQVTGTMQFDASEDEESESEEEEEVEHLDAAELEKEAEALRKELARINAQDDDFEEVEVEMELDEDKPKPPAGLAPVAEETEGGDGFELEVDDIVPESEEQPASENAPTQAHDADSSPGLPMQETTPPSTNQMTKDQAREWITEFYQKHNPSKLKKVEKTLDKYEGKYEELVSELKQKYIVKADGDGLKQQGQSFQKNDENVDTGGSPSLVAAKVQAETETTQEPTFKSPEFTSKEATTAEEETTQDSTQTEFTSKEDFADGGAPSLVAAMAQAVQETETGEVATPIKPPILSPPSKSGPSEQGLSPKSAQSNYSTPQQQQQSPVPSLVAAMEQAVREVESDLPSLSPMSEAPGSAISTAKEVEGYGQGFGKDFEIPVSSNSQPGLENDPDKDTEKSKEDSVDGFFGVAYKKIEVPKKEYNIPSGPAFADEREFEKELSAEFNVKASTLNASSEGDDEFEDEFGGDPGPAAIDIHQITQKAREKAKFEEMKVMANLRNEMEKEKQKAQLEDSRGNKSENDDGGEIFAPGQALLSVHNTYVQESQKSECSAPLAGEVQQSGEEGENLAHSGIYVKDQGREEALQEEPLATNSLKARPLTDFVFKEEDEEEYEKQEQEQEILLRELEQKRHEEELAKQEEENRLQSEWAAVEQLRAEEQEQGPTELLGVGGVVKTVDTSHITYRETIEYFQQLDMSEDLDKIVPLELPTGLKTKMKSAIFKKNKLKFDKAEDKRDLVFLIAQQHYDPANPIHYRIIQTIYKRLTGADRCCPNVGSHWDVIGFQGNNPQTDLNRSQGILSLVQILWLCEKHHAMALKLHQLSLQEPEGWPFVCVSIGFTKEAVGALRRAQIYSECNRRKVILPVLHDMYLALFEDFYRMVKQAPATHHAVHLAEVRKIAETSASKCLKEFLKRRQQNQTEEKRSVEELETVDF